MSTATNDLDQLWADYSSTRAVNLRNRLVERYLPLVYGIAKRMHARLPSEVECDDLVSAGSLGLMQAVEAFDVTRGNQFNTFAGLRITGAMLDELRSVDWVPRVERTRVKRIKAAVAALEAELGREPTDDELTERVQATDSTHKRVNRDRQPVQMLTLESRTFNGDGDRDGTLEAALADKRRPEREGVAEVEELIPFLLRHYSVTDALMIRLYRNSTGCDIATWPVAILQLARLRYCNLCKIATASAATAAGGLRGIAVVSERSFRLKEQEVS